MLDKLDEEVMLFVALQYLNRTLKCVQEVNLSEKGLFITYINILKEQLEEEINKRGDI
jgi:hypothetical protein